MLSKVDLDIWDRYIQNLWSKPEGKFQPTKVRDDESTYLDLHGLTIQQAFNTTNLFLERHYAVGSREITIITGKNGKINEEFPHWCENYSFVSNCDPLIDTHGQVGAYLIKLKKVR